MSQLDILKLLQAYGEETDLADFTPEELQEALERMFGDGEPLPTSAAAFKERLFKATSPSEVLTIAKDIWK